METQSAMKHVLDNLNQIGWAVLYSVIGSLLGILIVFITSSFLPRLIDKITPNMDEEKEIARGNQAVAEYFGRIVSSAILGISIIVAASIIGGLIVVLY
jgi:hypothetical protein